MTMQIAGRIVTPDGVVEDGHVTIDGPLIASVGEGRADGAERAAWVLPGFVDIHNHGGGGHTFTTGDPDAARAAAAFHLRHGSTTVLASLVSSPFALMRDATAAFVPLVREGVLGGVHYEGPYLSGARCGAQNPDFLRDPDTDELAALIALGDGAVRMMTIAPELPGALDAIALLASHGVAAAVGHTDAPYDVTRAAAAAGATVATHLFNGMRPVHHREPGPVLALLDSPGVICEVVADGVHLHDGTLSFVAGAARGGYALVTDAMAAAGMPDGAYELGGLSVVVADRVARLAANGSIAGSTLTMDAALRQAVGAGIPVADASRAASWTPARAVGLSGTLGAITPGLRADLVLLSEDLQVTGVVRAGVFQ
ncbi:MULTISPECIES: N-acetylglucosamine-6-phosphate deacetylase [Catenuloplanes]|uniref:N-acetylglucosamine-6-phosphate deacetylase n=1 Tax=Catenuloplanes niger TaxID=587534 RepID=A0AAE4CWL9_9ACTN|nr:N-acetylglucosamine-6-phosphate deacetylase [Catenuloplanes niger]MDR7323909.1 N-acetylglucosamine-6-phosphate deacetylase [Catenuloplanes niger]